MKIRFKVFLLSTIIFLIFTGCKKEDSIEPKSCTLFSVDLDINKFKMDLDLDASYLVAYTPDGKLLGYGNLADSSTWDLKAKYNGDLIDIVFYQFWHGNTLNITHIKNVNTGLSFIDMNKIKPNTTSSESIEITFKVEDFGNRSGNSTSSDLYEAIPIMRFRGYAYPSGEFSWDNIKEGYTYVKRNFLSDGLELIMFERGTNKPYLYYLDIPTANLSSGDTITLNKSDFSLAELKTVQISASNNGFDNIFLYGYNSVNGGKDLISSFEQVPSQSNGNSIRYISSEALPINHWDLRYFTNSQYTSYTIRSNKEIPASIEIKELTGQKITKSGKRFDFTHGNVFPDKKLARSNISFSKSINSYSFYYELYFGENESTGSTSITPPKIPDEIISKYNLEDINNAEWHEGSYTQTYTNLSGNSPLDFLKNMLGCTSTVKNSSSNEYSYEEFIYGF